LNFVVNQNATIVYIINSGISKYIFTTPSTWQKTNLGGSIDSNTQIKAAQVVE
jgi:hypothetical protein